MKQHTLLLDTLKIAQRIELVGDYMHIHPVEYFRPHGTDGLYAQVDDSTFTAEKYNKVTLSIYASTGRFESEVKISNVPGVICLLNVSEVKLVKKELREIKRVELLKETNIIVGQSEYNVLLKNISLGGVCFELEKPISSATGILNYISLKNQSINIPFRVVKERYDQERIQFIYHCQFSAYSREVENVLEKEVVALQLQQMRGNRGI